MGSWYTALFDAVYFGFKYLSDLLFSVSFGDFISGTVPVVYAYQSPFTGKYFGVFDFMYPMVSIIVRPVSGFLNLFGLQLPFLDLPVGIWVIFCTITTFAVLGIVWHLVKTLLGLV